MKNGTLRKSSPSQRDSEGIATVAETPSWRKKASPYGEAFFIQE